jgi:hypothetical protein
MARLWPQGELVEMELQSDGLPLRFLWHGNWHPVAHVANRWRVRVSWWLPAAHAAREYVKLTTTDGLLCTLYRDLADDRWYCARVFD